MADQDICEIRRVRECIEAGSHTPLEIPGEDGPFQWSGYLTQNGVEFGIMRFCIRCGLVYWEPKAPLEFQVVDEDSFEVIYKIPAEDEDVEEDD